MRGRNDLSFALGKLVDFVLKEKRIVKTIYKDPQYNDEPKIFNYGIEYKTKRTDNLNIASGFSFDKKLALVRVLGEALERYSLETYTPFISAVGSIEKIRKIKDFISPMDISPFSKKQLNQKKNGKFVIKKNSNFSWAKAVLFNKNKEILIPAQMISFNYNYLENEPIILPINSTGTALGIKFEDAFYRALCELIERDAFIISYLNKLPSPKIDLNLLKSTKMNKILGVLSRYKLELCVLNLTTDLEIPVFAAIIIDRTGLGPAISIGLKAGWEIENGIIGSIEEALMSRSWIRDKIAYAKKETDIKNIETIEQRALLWFPVEMINELDFWLKNNKVANMDKNEIVKNKLEKVLKILLKNNMSIIYKDITPPVLKASGFFVIRAIVPQLQPLYLNEEYKFLGEKRLYSVPNRLGFSRKEEMNLNKIPHPFL